MRYLMITFLRKAGGQIDEMVRIGKRVKDSDLTTCNIILDYGLRKVNKCIVERQKLDRTFDQMNDYYKKIYPALIEQLEKEAPITVQAKEKEKTGK